VNESGVPLLIYYYIGTAHPFYCQWFVNDGALENGDRKRYVIPVKAAGWFKFQLTSEGAGCPDTTHAGDRLNYFTRWAYGGVGTEEYVVINPMP
jgi:hypothetical protein